MSTYDPVSPPPRDSGASEMGGGQGKAQQVGDTAQQEGQELAQSAAQEAGSVAETVQEQAARVADEMGGQARELVSSAASQLEQQAEAQTHRVADVLRSAGDQARALAEGRSEDAGDADRYVRQVAGTLTRIAERIDSLGARGSIDELQQFARRRPGAFLAGAAAAGLLTSRFVRNTASRTDGQDGTAGDLTPIPPRTTPAPTAGLAAPIPPRPAAPPAGAPATGAIGGTQNTGGPAGGSVSGLRPEVR